MSDRIKLRPGLSVELVVPEGEFAGKYRTRIDEVGEKLLSVLVPYVQNQIIPLREGSFVEIVYWDKISAYSIEAKIIQRIAVPVPVLVLELSGIVRKVQRRKFVRVPAFYTLSYRMVNREGLGEAKKGDMLNLSGGGMLFHTKEPIENNALIYASLQLPSGELLAPARVCRVEKTEDGRAYAVSVEFHEISERERDRIIRCVFDLQRVMRKKGLV